jgi:hypothetical protein
VSLNKRRGIERKKERKKERTRKEKDHEIVRRVTSVKDKVEMKEITVSLIREGHPTKSVEDLEKLRCINLNDKQIEIIDNLEVFFDIEELHLSRNRITKIENLNFLNNLKFLDISYNNINCENLIASIEDESIPKSLKEINISGNPCANDESVLMILQDYIPELLIIVGIEEEDTQNNSNTNNNVKTTSDSDDNESDDDINEIDTEADKTIYDSMLGKFEDYEINSDTSLNPDELLKRIVDRKCKLQNIELYNLDSAITVNYNIFILST